MYIFYLWSNVPFLYIHEKTYLYKREVKQPQIWPLEDNCMYMVGMTKASWIICYGCTCFVAFHVSIAFRYWTCITFINFMILMCLGLEGMYLLRHMWPFMGIKSQDDGQVGPNLGILLKDLPCQCWRGHVAYTWMEDMFVIVQTRGAPKSITNLAWKIVHMSHMWSGLGKQIPLDAKCYST